MEGSQYTNAAFKSDQAPAYTNQPPPSMGGTYPQNQTFIQQAYVPPSSQVGVVVPTPPPPVYPQAERFRFANALIGLGITQLVIGVFIIIIEIVLLAHVSSYLSYYVGIWSGVFYILAGVFGIVAGKLNNMGCVIACMIACIINAVIIVTTALGLYANELVWYVYYYQRWVGVNIVTIYALVVVGMLLCCLEFIIAIIHSAFTCVVCCGRTTVTTYPTYQQPQAVYITTQQTVPYATQQTGGYPPAQY